MHVRQAALAAMVIVACGPYGAELSERAPETPAPSTIAPRLDVDPDAPYDQVFQKSVHNAYARLEPLLDQLVYHRVRSVELDVHSSRAGRPAAPGEWFVYHGDQPFSRDSSCARLVDCLGQLRAFHDALPAHDVVTLFVDLKDDFSPRHQPSDLDAAITGVLGRENLVTPDDVLRACDGAPTLRAAVTGRCGFPAFRALRGKFLVAVTGGPSCDARSPVSAYGGPRPIERAAFLAPNAEARCPIETYDARPDVVFFNLAFRNHAMAAGARRRGLVARVYGGALGGVDSAEDFAAARAAGATLVATNRVSFDRDAWSTGGAPASAEPGAIVGATVTSGDQWDTADSGLFAYETDTAHAVAGDVEEWSALVSVPSSHVEPFAKACLVARESEDAAATSFAVCRPFDENPPRAQVRRRRGGRTESFELGALGGINAETPAFLKLALKSTTGGTDATALASSDGVHWHTITTVHLGAALPLRGIGVSSHGRAPVKGLFANLVRARARGARAELIPAAGLRTRTLGSHASGRVFDGVFPR